MTHDRRRSMTPRRSRRPVLAALALVVAAAVVAACGGSGTSPSAGPSAADATASTPPSASTLPTASTPASSATPVASAPSAPAASAECEEPTTTLTLPSDRFTDIRVTTTPTADRITFLFGESSLPGPAEPPMGELSPAGPPYTYAGSGAKIAMAGDYVVVVGFATMSLQNDAGQETYGGPPTIKPDLPALKQAVLFDASEGAIGWYIGYDGGGCLAFDVTRDAVTLTIGHP